MNSSVSRNQTVQLKIISKYYHPRIDGCGNFYISSHSHTIVETYFISTSSEPRNPNQGYAETAVFDCLKEYVDYTFFEFMDCMIYVLYSDHRIRFDSDFIEFIADLNDSMKSHGIDYVIVEDHLQLRTENVIMDSVIRPCMIIMQRHSLIDADKYLSEAFQSYKKGNNNEAITYAVKSLENVVQSILDIKKIDCESKATKLPDRIPLLLRNTNSEFLSKKMSDQYIQMEKIFQVAMSSRNEAAHGSNIFEADDALVEHTVNIVSSDILFLVKISLEK